mmetsp:Transcript_103508/g.221338  ORF Transcript_103508/g.221338 Transcript_103508/m.221338 type:complete len:202 (-) Transcript_103508:282-887(-)
MPSGCGRRTRGAAGPGEGCLHPPIRVHEVHAALLLKEGQLRGRAAAALGAAARRELLQQCSGSRALHLHPLAPEAVGAEVNEHRLRCCVALCAAGEAHEPEATGAVRTAVHHHDRVRHRPIAAEVSFEVIGGHILWEAAHKDLVGGALLRTLARHRPLHINEAPIQPLRLRQRHDSRPWRVVGHEAKASGAAVLRHHDRID